MHILSPITNNCSSWIGGRGRMAAEMFSWPSLHERMCRTWGSNSGPLACQADSLSIELPRPVEEETVIVHCCYCTCGATSSTPTTRTEWLDMDIAKTSLQSTSSINLIYQHFSNSVISDIVISYQCQLSKWGNDPFPLTRSAGTGIWPHRQIIELFDWLIWKELERSTATSSKK